MKVLYRLIFVLGMALIILGSLFKVMHWPFAMIMTLIGFGFIGLIFTPIYFVYRFRKQNEWIYKLLDFISIMCLVNLSIGSMLRLLNIELGDILSLIGLTALAGFFIPLLIFVISKNKENRIRRIFILAISILYLFLSIYITYILQPINKVTKSYLQLDSQVQENKFSNYHDSRFIYLDLIRNHPDKEKIIKLKEKTDSICNYIQSIKIEIVKDCSNNESSVYTKLFIEKKALGVKNAIIDYKKFINQNFSKYGVNEDLDKSLLIDFSKDNSPDSWENEHFNHLPMIGVTTVLSGLISSIRSAELTVLYNLKK